MHPLVYRREGFKSGEHAFQAAKAIHRKDHLLVKHAVTPVAAKKVGRRIAMRSDWEDVKIEVMREVLRSKFANREMRKLLLATGDDELIEGNYWGDRFWGVCNGRGHNWLGKLLMEVRAECRIRS